MNKKLMDFEKSDLIYYTTDRIMTLDSHKKILDLNMVIKLGNELINYYGIMTFPVEVHHLSPGVTYTIFFYRNSEPLFDIPIKMLSPAPKQLSNRSFCLIQ